MLSRKESATGAPAASLLGQPIVAGITYTVDSLPNGLRYYVHARRTRSERTELRLVVDAGSVEEEADQRGLAHGVEHMVFAGTRSFPAGAIERWFDAIGMRRGDDVNATTYMDNTQYRMAIPTARPGALDTALAMLASIAHEATFDSAAARRESGVLLEEWRSSRDAEERAMDARHPLLYAGTPYVDRRVIGDTATLRRFDLRALRRYYERWYRPELMAVIVVGNFDSKEVEAMVRRHFASIPSRGSRQHRPALPGPPPVPAAPRTVVVADPEARSPSVGVWQPVSRQRYHTRADYRAGVIVSLWRALLRARLEEASLRADSPLADVDVERRGLARAMSADVVSITAMKGKTLPALEIALGEMRELARRGPTAEELTERKRAMLRAAREDAQDGEASVDLAAEFVDNFLTGNAVFTDRLQFDLASDILPTIDVADVRAFARTRGADSGAVIAVTTTADDPIVRLPADSILARARTARRDTTTGPAEIPGVDRLLATDPAPGSVAAERELPEVKAYEWTLSNGMRVLLKPSDFRSDEIRFRALAPGGASLASDDRYASAYMADAILGETGVGTIAATRLSGWLAANSISLSPRVTDDAVSLDGTTAPANLDEFLQLVHLYLTAPRRDTVAFRRYRTRMASMVETRSRDPGAVFDDSVEAALSGGDPRAMKTGARFYQTMRLDDALDFWKQRTANGSGFVVAIVGDFTLERVRPLVARYLASIPRGAPERPRGRPFPATHVAAHHDIASGVVERARTAIGFSAPVDLSNENAVALNTVRDLISRAMNERLREEMGGTYGVDVSYSADVAPPSRYTITIEFESAPARIEALAAAATEELARLHRTGPTAAEFAATREARVRDFDGEMDDNDFWVDELVSHARYGWPFAGIVAHPHDAEATTIEDVRGACARFIPLGGYVRVTMRPLAKR